MYIWLSSGGDWDLGTEKSDELIITRIIYQYVSKPIYFAYGIHSHYIETYFTDFQFVPIISWLNRRYGINIQYAYNIAYLIHSIIDHLFYYLKFGQQQFISVRIGSIFYL